MKGGVTMADESNKAEKLSARLEAPVSGSAALTKEEETYYMASGRKLMWWKFKKHRIALIALPVIILLYLGAAFSEFFSPTAADKTHSSFKNCPPQIVRIWDEEDGLCAPFVYGLNQTIDTTNFIRVYELDKTVRYPVSFFSSGEPYKLWGLIPGDVHLFSSEGPMFIIGTDDLGRDMLSRVIYGSRISLSIGLAGVTLTFFLGLLLGALSGYIGGWVDSLIQRLIELLMCIPPIPLWMTLAASLPRDWSTLQTYMGIVVVMSLVNWTGLARVVRGMILANRGEDFVLAARISGARGSYIMRRHLMPTMASYIIVHLTMAIPGSIVGETLLSFLGLGLRPPVISWGVIMQSANNLHHIAGQPWLLMPLLWLVVASLCFNFIGDGLRDAADPYK